MLLHGLTATRRYVVHGSKLLPRRGFATVAYDARGHGESEPGAGAERATRYAELVADLGAVARPTARRSARCVLAGHSMGAHTAVAYALAHPERVAGLVVIGPAYIGLPPSDESLRLLGRARRRARARRGRGLRRAPTTTASTRVARDAAAHHPRAARDPPPPRGGRPGAARGAALAPFEDLAELEFLRPAGAGGREPRRGRPGPPLRGRRGLGGAAAAGEPDQRGAGRIAARLAGRAPLARDRRLLRAPRGRRAARRLARGSRAGARAAAPTRSRRSRRPCCRRGRRRAPSSRTTSSVMSVATPEARFGQAIQSPPSG